MTQFWTKARLRNHLARSESCLAVHLATDCAAAAADQRSDVEHRPVTRLVGPQPYWAQLRPSLPPNVEQVPLPSQFACKLREVESQDEASCFLKWWVNASKLLTEEEIHDNLEQVIVADLIGHKAAAYAVALFISWPEAGSADIRWAVARRGHTFVACLNENVAALQPPHRAFLFP